MKNPTRSYKKIQWTVNSNGCFECYSHCSNENGYPTMRVMGKLERISRIIYRECFGEIPDNMCVMHKCDNTRCINPEHLTLGTLKDNSIDMARKGRQHVQKLTVEQVKEIKASSDTGVNLARKYGVLPTTICEIRKGRNWKHVE